MILDRNTYSGRSVLRSLGTGQVQATLALQQIQVAPRSSDPDAAATVVIVKAVQRGLNQLGCPVAITGRLDTETAACLSRISGPSWESRNWIKITKDIIVMRDAGLKIQGPEIHEPMGDFVSQAGGLLLIGGIVYLALKYKK